MDQYLPGIRKKYGLPCHLMSYISIYLNDRETFYLIIREIPVLTNERFKRIKSPISIKFGPEMVRVTGFQ